MKPNYNHTRLAAYLGIFVQAVTINLAPLLFIVFQSDYGLSYEQLGRLTLMNFLIQIAIDLLMVKYGNRIPLRVQAIVANVFSALGLISLSILPRAMSGSPYAALIISVCLLAVGGGIIEVGISPLVSALPSSGSKAEIPLLHSFYCWGHVLTCALSTLFLFLLGSEAWYLLPLIWSVAPIIDTVLFLTVPIVPLVSEQERTPMKKLFSSEFFIIALLVMICAGASEQSIAQWVSFFAEEGLEMPKLLGDLLGLCGFALMMALVRMSGGLFGSRLDMKKTLMASSALCVLSYLGITLIPIPAVSLVCSALCGISVALMWPGTLSMVSEAFPKGGVGMFSLVAVMGDIGCSLGPWLVGAVSDRAAGSELAENFTLFSQLSPTSTALRIGIFFAVAFPSLMFVLLHFIRKPKKQSASDNSVIPDTDRH